MRSFWNYVGEGIFFLCLAGALVLFMWGCDQYGPGKSTGAKTEAHSP